MLEELLLSGFLTLWTRQCDVRGNNCTDPQRITTSLSVTGKITAPSFAQEFSTLSFKTDTQGDDNAEIKFVWLKRENISESIVARVRLFSGQQLLSECTHYSTPQTLGTFPEGSCSGKLKSLDPAKIMQLGVSYSRQSF
ncbi:MAG: hypothetical protein ACLGGX_08810 [Bdellovibrionia bacterium]